MNKTVYHQLFATPAAFIRDVLTDHHDVVSVAGDVYQYYKDRQQWRDVGGHHGGVATYWFVNDIVQQFSRLQTVYDQVQPHVDAYARELTGNQSIQAAPVMSWLTFYDHNAFAMKHNHTFRYDDNKISVMNINAIVYLQVDRNDKLDLYWPSNVMQTGIGHLNYSNKAGAVPLVDNQLVLLPAWVDHGAEARRRQRQKIIMSINYQYLNCK